MSKNNPSEVKLSAPLTGGFPGLKSLNLQVFVMIAAIIVIMLFFTWAGGRRIPERAQRLQPASSDGDHRYSGRGDGFRDYLCGNRPLRWLNDGAIRRRRGNLRRLARLAIAAYDCCHAGAGFTARRLERVVGRLPESPFVYRHPGRDAGFPWHSHWHHEWYNRLAHQLGDVADWSELLIQRSGLHNRRHQLNGVYRLAMARAYASAGSGA